MDNGVPGGTAVFAIHDGTTYRNLRPIADALPTAVDVEFLLLDDLFGDDGVPADDLQPHRRATDYVRDDLFVRLNRRSRPAGLGMEGLQWVLEDLCTARIPYRLDTYLADADPALFVCGHDRLPFVKHVLRRCQKRGVPTAVVQHGIQRFEHLPADSRLVDALRPTRNPTVPALETAKRRLLYQYGAYIFGNPYVDAVFTIGEYFTDQIRAARAEYPCSGHGTVTTTGYPEYGLTDMAPYDPAVDSAVYLSGWEYELGEWGQATERQIADRLAGIVAANDVDLRVRPHPKDSAEKIEQFYADIPVSDEPDLATDIDRHDLVVTVYSTALLLAAARGKVCGVLRIPWERNRFGPFEADHVLEIDEDRTDVHDRATARSTETQRRFLERFCYVPPVHGDGAGPPAEYAATTLWDLATRDQ